MDQSFRNPFGSAVSGRDAPSPDLSSESGAMLPLTQSVIPLPSEDGNSVSAMEEAPTPYDDSDSSAAPEPAPDAGQTPAASYPFTGEGAPVSDPSLAYVRLLHAVSDAAPMRVVLGNRLLIPRLSAGNMTGSFAVRPGFYNLALFDAVPPSSMIYLGPVPFSAGEIVTLAIVRSANNGVDLVRVDDRACYMRGTNRACVRAVNLIYNSPPLDIILTDGRAVFTDVRFKEITGCRRAKAGQYDMYTAQTPYVLPSTCTDIETVEELPVAAANYFLPGFGTVEPLASFGLETRAGATETIYLMGNWDLGRSIWTRVVENY